MSSTTDVFRDVWEIFEVAIHRSKRDDLKLKSREIMDKISRIIRHLDKTDVDPEVVYYALIGLADDYLVPLTPGDIEDVREIVIGRKLYR